MTILTPAALAFLTAVFTSAVIWRLGSSKVPSRSIATSLIIRISLSISFNLLNIYPKTVELEDLEILSSLVEEAGFNPDYYTGIHSNYDLPYDFYRPSSNFAVKLPLSVKKHENKPAYTFGID